MDIYAQLPSLCCVLPTLHRTDHRILKARWFSSSYDTTSRLPTKV